MRRAVQEKKGTATHKTGSRLTDATVREHLGSLIPDAVSRKVPAWPPDAFACCMSLLQKSGAYCSVLEDWPPATYGTSKKWVAAVRRVGDEWRASWAQKTSAPLLVQKLWRAIVSRGSITLDAIGGDVVLRQALLELSAIADDACRGIGVADLPDKRHPEFYDFADALVQDRGSLNVALAGLRLRVLPKMHSPKNGLTIRSFSHHLALCVTDEVNPRWVQAVKFPPEFRAINLLLVPWPPKVRPVQFRPVDALQTEMRNLPKAFGFFSFANNSAGQEVVDRTMALYREATKLVGRVHGVILPECSITADQHERLSERILTEEAFLVGGVGEVGVPGQTHGRNYVCIDVPGVTTLEQHKHHRWRLDGPQIVQYGLGAQLYPLTSWWEHIRVGNRELHFVSMLPWLVTTVLICEDLARPDPAGDIVRAIGPNLVICLLMDGPQLKERWGARYATTLADDPGCSVLTLTSLGMAQLSRPLSGGVPRSRVIGLWKDARTPSPVEIELPLGSDAVVISLSVEYMEEWTADGRSDDQNTGYPLLSGIHYVNISSK
jgi:hypothetical protein